MEQRLAARDSSLNSKTKGDTDSTLLDWLKEPGPDPESRLAKAEKTNIVRDTVEKTLGRFNARERYIVQHRLMDNDSPKTLQHIGDHFHISRERIRQIELGVKHKLRTALKDRGIHRAAV